MKNSVSRMINRRKRQEYSELSNEELVDLVEKRELEIEKLKAAIQELEDKVDLKGKATLKRQTTILQSYNSQWTWVSKIIYILRFVNKPLTMVQIFAYLTEKDSFIGRYSRDQNKLKVNLTKATKYQRVLAYKIKGLKEHYYCLPEWFSQQNELLPGYEIEPPLT